MAWKLPAAGVPTKRAPTASDALLWWRLPPTPLNMTAGASCVPAWMTIWPSLTGHASWLSWYGAGTRQALRIAYRHDTDLDPAWLPGPGSGRRHHGGAVWRGWRADYCAGPGLRFRPPGYRPEYRHAPGHRHVSGHHRRDWQLFHLGPLSARQHQARLVLAAAAGLGAGCHCRR